MKRKTDKAKTGTVALMALAMAAGMASCEKSQSYSELLRDEEHACNWFLAQKRIITEVPSDSVFQTGVDAPFYKLDNDGYLYMQVINPGDKDDKAKTGDKVYFRYERQNIRYMYENGDYSSEGNSSGMDFSNTKFIYGNYTLPSSSQWGQGIQKPLDFLGYNSEVNLVLKSYYGFVADQTMCMPYIINVRYFKPAY